MRKPLLSALVFATALFSAMMTNAQCGYVAPPVAQNDTVVLTTQLSTGTVSVNAVGTDLKWYSDAAATSPISGGTGTPFDTRMNGTGVTASSPKQQCFYVTQTIAGCESKTDDVCVSIVACPWMAPTKVGVAKCENDVTLATTAMNVNSIEQGINWQWYTDAALSYPIPNATTQTYIPGGTTVGDTYYYVRFNKVEPISGQSCWSPATMVTRSVYPKPAPAFTSAVKSDYCYTDNVINLSGLDNLSLPGTNLFTVDGAMNASGVIVLGTLTTDKTFTIHYFRTTEKGCKDSVSKSISVHYVAPPATTNFSKAITSSALPTISATPNPSINSIQWYDASKVKIASATASVYTENSQPTSSGDYSYYAKQTDIFGCVSDYSKATISYTNCSAATPIYKHLEMCTYDNTPTFTITRGFNANANHQYEYRIYRFDPAIIGEAPLNTIASNSSTFDPSPFINKANPGNNLFWIAEYDLTDGCMGKATEMILTVNGSAAPNAVANAPICENTFSSISLSVSGYPKGSTILWYDSTATIIAEASTSGSKFTGNPYVIAGINTLNEGTYRYYASSTVAFCQSAKIPVTFKINPKPAPPVGTGDGSCYGFAFKALSVSGLPNAAFKWYATTDLSQVLQQGAYYTPTTITTYVTSSIPFYVTQTSSGENCTSEPTIVYYQLYGRPAIPIFAQTNQSICQASNVIPIYTVTNASGQIAWDDNGTSATGTSYTPKLPASGALVTSFTAKQTENGCESSLGTATLVLIKTPDAPLTGGDQSICLNNKTLPFVAKASGNYTLKWYSDFAEIWTSNYIGTGSSYLPNPIIYPTSNETQKVSTYYITQTTTNANRCESPATSVKLTIFNKYCIDSTITLNNGDSVLIGNKYHKKTESFDYTYTSTTGVDSVVHYNLVLTSDTTGSRILNPNTISISPVPAKNKLHITNNGKEQIEEISVISEKGQLLYSNKKKVLGNTEIDLSGFSSGIYLLRYIIDGKLGAKTFVVVK